MVIPFLPVLSLDHVSVIKELEECGVLSKEHQTFTDTVTRQNNESQTWAGAIQFTKSKTLTDWIDRHQIPVDRAVVFVNRPGMVTRWHIDGPAVKTAINIPWFGDQKTYTEWMVRPIMLNESRKVFNADNSIRRIELINNETNPTHCEVMDRAYLVDISKYHRIDALESNTIRGLVSLRFQNYLKFESLSELIRSSNETV